MVFTTSLANHVSHRDLLKNDENLFQIPINIA